MDSHSWSLSHSCQLFLRAVSSCQGNSKASKNKFGCVNATIYMQVEFRNLYRAKFQLNTHASRNRPTVHALSFVQWVGVTPFQYFCISISSFFFSIITKLSYLCLSGKCIFILLWIFFFFLRTSAMKKKKKEKERILQIILDLQAHLMDSKHRNDWRSPQD